MDYNNIKVEIEQFLKNKESIIVNLESNYSFVLKFQKSPAGVCGTIFRKPNCNSTELVFYQDEAGMIKIEGLKVQEEMQRKGIGSQLFDILIQIITVLNKSESFLKVYKKINEIEGDLSPYEFPYDQYDKSIPFYMKKSNEYGFEFLLYGKNDFLESFLVEEEDYLKFIKEMPSGRFEMKMAR